jgi:hypothetical protein
MSVMDWWVSLREQVLNIPIACRCYGPSKPSSLMSIEGGFTPTALMASSWEKLGTDPRIGQPSYYGLCWEPFFSGAVALSIVVNDFTKGCYALPHEIHMDSNHTRTEHGMCVTCWSGFPLQGVHRFELPRLSDMSIAYLRQSSRR